MLLQKQGGRATDNFIKLNQVGQIYGTEKEPNPQAGRVYNSDGISPTLDSCSGGNRMPKVLEEPSKKSFVERKYDNFISKKGYMPEMFNAYHEKEIKEVSPTQTANCCDATSSSAVLICASRGRNPENPSDRTKGTPTEQRLEINKNGISNTITTVQKDNYLIRDYRIRKLTPKECWRLMSFSDDDFGKAEKVNSSTQLYKQAGNSIVVNVLERILERLIK